MAQSAGYGFSAAKDESGFLDILSAEGNK